MTYALFLDPEQLEDYRREQSTTAVKRPQRAASLSEAGNSIPSNHGGFISDLSASLHDEGGQEYGVMATVSLPGKHSSEAGSYPSPQPNRYGNA